MTKKVAVIAGAGPAGLTAAYELLKRTDIVPIVCEATDAIGGIAQTYNYKGNRIDIGGHRFFSKSERVMKWWFNILPLQGAPAADTEEKQHEIDYAVEAVMEFLCPECIDGLRDTSHELRVTDGQDEEISRNPKPETRNCRVRLPAPDPSKEDRVMLQRPRLSRIFYKRHFFPYPIGITLNVARRLGLWNTVLIGFSYIKRQIMPIRDETYLDAFYRNRFGDRLYRTFFEAYTEKVWGVPCGEIRADWGAQRVKGLSLKRAVAHAIKDLLSSDFKKAQEERETSLITRFYYPKFGPGQMWETVADEVSTCGGEVRLKRRIAGVKIAVISDQLSVVSDETMEANKKIHTDHSPLTTEYSRVTSVMIENIETGDIEEVACDYFFSTMPIKHLISMMHPLPPPRVVEVADGLHYRDFLTVGLLLKKLHVEEKGKNPATDVPDNWIYIQEGGVRVGRVQIFNNWSPYMVADRENSIWIGLEYFVSEGGDLWVMDDQALIDLGIAEMEKIGFCRKDDVLDACVLRMHKAYPAYWGSYDQLDVVREYVEGIENLFLIGRNGMHRYNNQDHSMLTAMTAVDNIIEGRRDKSNIWEVNLDMVYHEEKK